jgi:predicted negative regulator of RcsB-dependent stress response
MKTDALKLVDNLAEISHNAIVSEAIGDTYARANQLEKATQWWQKAKTMGGQSKNLDKKIATQKMIE